MNELQWIYASNMNKARFIASSVLVPCHDTPSMELDNNQKEKLFVIGGWNRHDLINGEVYDFRYDEWTEIKSVNYGRYEAGIYYDFNKNHIYLGGGYSWDENKQIPYFEYYNIDKNIWYKDLPPTKLKHRQIPMIWMENNNLLSITSIIAQGIEYIDLRCNPKQWTVIYKRKESL